MILMSKVRTSASKKINQMALIRTLTISTTTFERIKEKFYGFRQTDYKTKYEHSIVMVRATIASGELNLGFLFACCFFNQLGVTKESWRHKIFPALGLQTRYQKFKWMIPLKEAATLLTVILCDPNFAVSYCFEAKIIR